MLIYLDIKIIAIWYLIKSAFPFDEILLNVTDCVLPVLQILKVENIMESGERNFDELPGVRKCDKHCLERLRVYLLNTN